MRIRWMTAAADLPGIRHPGSLLSWPSIAIDAGQTWLFRIRVPD